MSSKTLLRAQSHAGRKLAQSVVEGTQAQTVGAPYFSCCCCVFSVPDVVVMLICLQF